MTRQPLVVVSKLVISELVDVLPQFNRTLRGVVPTVPPREIVTDQFTRLLFRAVILMPSTTLKRDFL
jgi:hypothetical protein